MCFPDCSTLSALNVYLCSFFGTQAPGVPWEDCSSLYLAFRKLAPRPLLCIVCSSLCSALALLSNSCLWFDLRWAVCAPSCVCLAHLRQLRFINLAPLPLLHIKYFPQCSSYSWRSVCVPSCAGWGSLRVCFIELIPILMLPVLHSSSGCHSVCSGLQLRNHAAGAPSGYGGPLDLRAIRFFPIHLCFFDCCSSLNAGSLQVGGHLLWDWRLKHASLQLLKPLCILADSLFKPCKLLQSPPHLEDRHYRKDGRCRSGHCHPECAWVVDLCDKKILQRLNSGDWCHVTRLSPEPIPDK